MTKEQTVRLPIGCYEWDKNARANKRSLLLAVDDDGKMEREPVALPVLELAGEREGPALLILAGVHGDEYEGIETILRLFADLQPEHVSGNLLMIPCANPYAYRGGTRSSQRTGSISRARFPADRTAA
ncbi:hypothetical protein SD70_13930 [Gordoniibacillus kamchatkensis]|uniref:Succinylglutamate desuccinylase/Aspartoacylase catalytic domain-containing protein n=1 Tax=Gordoniibacillus kamchatkensis TaxID=1590651 RepID=A0ABR5AH93_9BACL|nr:succinylglutamate desuccinylase/aspartoacylase family protein [Paenibacillus sp. VKM B-2647]KIL40341.1 hypothetical protein SD70_13930 [Paenibacillus sp. VKM B-2647]